MRGKKCSDSNWDKLLNRIKNKKVIPVIGQGLYQVYIEAENIRNCLLYDYLAEQILKKCEVPISPGKKIKFPDACLEFLKKNDENYVSFRQVCVTWWGLGCYNFTFTKEVKNAIAKGAKFTGNGSCN